MKPVQPITINMKRWFETVDDQDVFIEVREPFTLMLAQQKITSPEQEHHPVIAQPKLDGVRMIYDPRWGKLFTRNHQEIECLDHILAAIKAAGLQDMMLDGEVYLHGLSFDQINRLVRDEQAEEKHLQLEYHIFDWCNQLPMVERLHKLRSIHWQKPLHLVDTRMLISQTGIRKYYEYCLKQGYEGIMLRNPGSSYGWGRSRNLRRIKPVDDTEAKIIGFTQGRGKNASTFGALVLKMGNGVVFKCAGISLDVKKRLAGGIGEVVTFHHNGFTDNGVPRMPRFKGVRADMMAA